MIPVPSVPACPELASEAPFRHRALPATRRQSRRAGLPPPRLRLLHLSERLALQPLGARRPPVLPAEEPPGPQRAVSGCSCSPPGSPLLCRPFGTCATVTRLGATPWLRGLKRGLSKI